MCAREWPQCLRTIRLRILEKSGANIDQRAREIASLLPICDQIKLTLFACRVLAIILYQALTELICMIFLCQAWGELSRVAQRCWLAQTWHVDNVLSSIQLCSLSAGFPRSGLQELNMLEISLWKSPHVEHQSGERCCLPGWPPLPRRFIVLAEQVMPTYKSVWHRRMAKWYRMPHTCRLAARPAEWRGHHRDTDSGYSKSSIIRRLSHSRGHSNIRPEAASLELLIKFRQSSSPGVVRRFEFRVWSWVCPGLCKLVSWAKHGRFPNVSTGCWPSPFFFLSFFD